MILLQSAGRNVCSPSLASTVYNKSIADDMKSPRSPKLKLSYEKNTFCGTRVCICPLAKIL